MSSSPRQLHSAADECPQSTFLPALHSHNINDGILEQKRAEHEFTRQEHRRRFEEQMQMLESKQQRDEAMIRTGETDTKAQSQLPVTPIKTPAQIDARSRSNTINKGTPPFKIFESRVTLNEQLVTPPSDHQVKISSGPFVGLHSVPGSRRTSTSLGFEGLSISEQDEGRFRDSFIAYGAGVDSRRPYAEQTRTKTQPEGQRLSMQKVFNDEDSGPSYLQMNTTDDSFPILVRKDSYAAGMMHNMKAEASLDSRAAPISTNHHTFTHPHNTRTNLDSLGQRGNTEHLEMVHGKALSELSPAGNKPYPGLRGNIYDPAETSRRAFASLPATSGRSPLGALPSVAGGMESPLLSPGLYSPYSVSNNRSVHSYASFPMYGMEPSQLAFADTQRLHNPYAVGRNPVYTKRTVEDANNRYADVALDSLIGDIYSLCKDQHGCRYLQKKLDERNVTNIDLIFKETYMHAAELMIDPFGNYLYQKLFEHCDDQKRLQIVQNVAPDLVNISLNMHGTRAVQKMIEYLTTIEQINIVTSALDMNAVILIKDLNGNHVIQKCLNRLGSTENQFIFDAVSNHCVEVATHRHGCCVLQRCIDHASEAQKAQIIEQINRNASLLVQDPFGNYVVQYVLDLGDLRFSDALIRCFLGNVCLFSVQKFSSNVIEKCLRVAEPQTRAALIQELLNRPRLEKLLRDSFANYVVQTALDYAESGQRQQLIECIRPLLPAIRSTPYGRRIQSKISGNYNNGAYGNNFCVPQTNNDFSAYQHFHTPAASTNMSNITHYQKSFKGDYEY